MNWIVMLDRRGDTRLIPSVPSVTSSSEMTDTLIPVHIATHMELTIAAMCPLLNPDTTYEANDALTHLEAMLTFAMKPLSLTPSTDSHLVS
jgi:hypothetical protein